jgi:hypothetical protein
VYVQYAFVCFLTHISLTVVAAASIYIYIYIYIYILNVDIVALALLSLLFCCCLVGLVAFVCLLCCVERSRCSEGLWAVFIHVRCAVQCEA